MMLSMAVDFAGGHFPIGCKTAEKSEWQGQIIKAWTSVNPASQNVMDALFSGYGCARKLAGKGGLSAGLTTILRASRDRREKQWPADRGSTGQRH
ncbi:hypothetical protein [Ciceribacter ferrooxidans]|uniref:Uncharacterized protein n=1 Tax=Ciceribacter ferrooxidans TaxID=2509717 RepID=A0A4Q2T1I1_9HYPH|nr:hypothetical protein [Ciceribacter ferrooxidans]RYC11843.1 hypothetical protein EUU22_12290 [Ciceribacter ferrooxidans]